MESVNETTIESDDSEVARWVTEIKLYETDSQEWVERGKRIVKRYKDKRTSRETSDGQRRYNILYSNVQTLLPAYFSRAPKPDIERRFKDKDVIGRMAAQVWERSTTYFTATDEFKDCIRKAVMDRLLPGRGVVWARYVPHMRDIQVTGNAEVRDDGTQITDDTEMDESPQEVYYEEVCSDYVYWEDFGHTVGRTWEEVRAVWRKVYLTRDELIKRFGEEIGKAVTLDYSPRGLSDEKTPQDMKKATVYEIWDKTSKKAKWLHKDHDKLLDSVDDPLQLDNFFPCPRPLYPVLTNDSLIPVPDFSQYQDQAKELDDLTARIAAITKSVKVAGVYDASAQGVERLLSEGTENRLIPVEQWAMFAEKGGIKGVIDFIPVADILKTLLGLYEAREKVKNDLYEITGIADIIRGATKASETATAQQIKSNFANLRLDDGQQEVQRFSRELVRIIAQIIANHFSLDTLKAISGIQLMTQAEKQQVQMQMQQQAMQAQQMGQQPPPPPEELQEQLNNPTWEEVYALLKDNAMRCFRIDIETDSTIKQDQLEDKRSRMEFLTAAGGFIQQAVEATTKAPELAPLLTQMLLFGVRGFKIGKDMENTFDIAMKKIEHAAENPPPAPPDHEAQTAQANIQLQQSKMQSDHMNVQAKMAMDKEQAQSDMQLESERLKLESSKIAGEMQLKREEMQMDAQLQREKMQGELDLKKQIEMMKLAMQAEAGENQATRDTVKEAGSTKAILAPMMEMIKALTASNKMTKKVILDNGREATVETVQ